MFQFEASARNGQNRVYPMVSRTFSGTLFPPTGHLIGQNVSCIQSWRLCRHVSWPQNDRVYILLLYREDCTRFWPSFLYFLFSIFAAFPGRRSICSVAASQLPLSLLLAAFPLTLFCDRLQQDKGGCCQPCRTEVT